MQNKSLLPADLPILHLLHEWVVLDVDVDLCPSPAPGLAATDSALAGGAHVKLGHLDVPAAGRPEGGETKERYKRMQKREREVSHVSSSSFLLVPLQPKRNFFAMEKLYSTVGFPAKA